MIQGDLFMTPRARWTDPVTSHVAAASAVTLAERHRDWIVSALRDGPGTIYELAERIGIDHVAVARRMAEIERAGLVERSGRTRSSPHGRPCMEWRKR